MCRALRFVGCIGWGLVFALVTIQTSSATELQSQLLVYRVFEPGSEPYVSRILVTDETLRLDQGEGDEGFILFDRVRKIIHSVNAGDRTVLKIKPPLGEKNLPAEFKLRAELVEEEGMPVLSGNQPEYWRLLVNEQLCRSAVVVPGLMSEAVRAYGEYLDLLAYQHLAALDQTPKEMHDPCDLVMHIYAPTILLQKGLPLREWSEQDWGQELADYRESYPISEESLRLPKDYRVITLGAF